MLGIILLIIALLFLAGTIIYAAFTLVVSLVEFGISSAIDGDWWGVPVLLITGFGLIFLLGLIFCWW